MVAFDPGCLENVCAEGYGISREIAEDHIDHCENARRAKMLLRTCSLVDKFELREVRNQI